jgi:hypothetical protein
MLQPTHCQCVSESLSITILDITRHPAIYLKTRRYGDWLLSPETNNNTSKVYKTKVWKMLPLVIGLCYVGFVNPTGVVSGVQRQSLALSIGTNLVGST